MSARPPPAPPEDPTAQYVYAPARSGDVEAGFASTASSNGYIESAGMAQVPSVVLTPASPMQLAHAHRASEDGGSSEADPEAAGGGAAASVEVERPGGAAQGSRRQTGNGAASTDSHPPQPKLRKRPQTAPSPSLSFSPPSSPPIPSPAGSSESRTFFAALASSIPSLPSIPSFNLGLGALLPSKLPGAPTFTQVEGSSGEESEGDDSEEGDGMQGRRSADLRIEEGHQQLASPLAPPGVTPSAGNAARRFISRPNTRSPYHYAG
ncbi:hypothetical protein JCM10213v2_008809 [Rhodosporidiobolus nylandii]